MSNSLQATFARADIVQRTREIIETAEFNCKRDGDTPSDRYNRMIGYLAYQLDEARQTMIDMESTIDRLKSDLAQKSDSELD